MERPEISLLKKFRQEARAARQEIQRLSQHHQALRVAIEGLEAVLRLQGVDPGSIEGETMDTPSGESRPGKIPAFVRQAVLVLERVKRPMGAKEIHRHLIERGLVVNYYTLHRALSREAVKTESMLSRVSDKFGLRRWTAGESSK